MMVARKVIGLRSIGVLMFVASVLCSACVQSNSKIVIGPNHSLKVIGANLPGLNGGSRNDDHHVSLIVSDTALADDVYHAVSFLLEGNAWEDVRLMLNDDEGIGIYYGSVDDYKPLIEYPSNINVRFKQKNDCKLLTVCYGASSKEFTESNVSELYDQFGKMGESWGMEVCCSRDYPFRDIIDLCRIAARNGCKLLYFVVCQK